MKNLFQRQLKKIIYQIYGAYNKRFNENISLFSISNEIYFNYYLNSIEIYPFMGKINFTDSLKKIRAEKIEIRNFKLISNYNEHNVIIEKNQKRHIISKQLISDDGIKLKLIDCESDKSYCYFYSSVLDDDFPEAMVRFYINCKYDGVIQIVEGICERLDKLKISFSLKCFKEPKDYIRSDNVVLYVYKYDWAKYFTLLKAFFEEHQEPLNSNIPLFTYPICHGIGLGENPNLPDESFGSLRCKLIGNSILKSIELSFTVEQCFEYTQSSLIEEGFDLQKIYLNPRSKFPYNFD